MHSHGVMGRLDPDSFLTELNKLYSVSKDKHSVWVTFKRHVPKGTDEVRCLVRATDGKKVNYSTMISAKDVVKFQIHLATLFKASFAALKKKEKHRGTGKKKATAGPAAASSGSGSGAASAGPAAMES